MPPGEPAVSHLYKRRAWMRPVSLAIRGRPRRIHNHPAATTGGLGQVRLAPRFDAFSTLSYYTHASHY